MASAFALGYMLAVPFLTGADRPHRCAPDPARRLGGERAGDVRLRLSSPTGCGRRSPSGPGRHRFCRRLHAGPQGADGSPAARRELAQRHALHGDASRSASASRSWWPRWRRTHLGWRCAFYITALGPLAMIAACLAHGAGRAGAVAAAGCSTSGPCSATAPRWASSWATARTASSSTRSGPGSWRSGRSWRRATAARRCWSRSRSASSPRMLAMPSSIIGNEAAIRFGRHRAIVLFMCSPGAGGDPDRLRGGLPRPRCCWRCCSSTPSPFPPTPAR